MFQSIVLVGATGRVGAPILRNLLESTAPVFNVTVLVRETTSADAVQKAKPIIRQQGSREYAVRPVDYENHDSLVQALKGADAVVSALPTTVAHKVDLLLLQAAQEAGVRRIFPSEYTLDVLHPLSVAAFGKDFPSVLNANKFLSLVDASDAPTSFTTIVPGMFFDYGLRGLLDMWDLKHDKAVLIDGGAEVFTGSSTGFIAACVVAALKMDEEKTKNKRIRIAEVQTTMEEVRDVLEEVSGRTFSTVDVSSEEMARKKEEAVRAQDWAGVYVNTILPLNFGGGGPGNLSEGLTFDGDGNLLVRRKTLRELVQEAFESDLDSQA
ncbi:NAD(P)-binding protein [Cryphonectria parasitica EP155]|uniref:NAD(P)-binding protein n=1 Tax=Cryphonectria parasitica (strain ATCC 38755 / EP155) TaxID=660469 RepID=A0A9P4Y4T2_CRYP1|nr:NAD(P)-binding protein [Cryphonectria parasitica EP155]KAF3766708.1 NAD(P)-binding protein [Cryphonectria parasitica EP155]